MNTVSTPADSASFTALAQMVGDTGQPEVAAARATATMAHGDQMYGQRPYLSHLDEVADLVVPYGRLHVVIAYLHDTLEDTELPSGQLRLMFGDHVADCVELITDPPSLPRHLAKAVLNDRLLHAPGRLDPAVVVKVADRLANVRSCMREGKVDLWNRYRAEHPLFWASAYRTGMCDALWADLNARMNAVWETQDGQR